MTEFSIEDEILQLADTVAPGVNELRSISNLVQEVSDTEAEIAALEETLKTLNVKRFDLLTKDLPDAMAAAGTSCFVTENGGLKVTVGTTVRGSIPLAKDDPTRHDAAIRYVDENGGSGIITADVVLKFGRQNAGRAREVVQLYKDRDDCLTSLKEEIHPMTLGKWARERIEQGLPVDGEKCGLWIGRLATIKPVKPKK